MKKLNYADRRVTIEEWNNRRKEFNKLCDSFDKLLILGEAYKVAWVDQTERYADLWVKEPRHLTRYRADLADNKVELVVKPAEAIKKFNRYYKVPILCDSHESLEYMSKKYPKKTFIYCPYIPYNKIELKFKENAAGPLIKSFVDKYDGIVYEYDINNAYGSVLKDGIIPDTTQLTYFGIVQDGQIGFDTDRQLTLKYPGESADIIAPLIKTDLDKWVKELGDICADYRKEPTEEKKKKKDAAKKQLVYAIGLLQQKNPLLRAYIVNTCNNRIESLIDENTVLANTDAIYSKVKRDDIEVGPNLGQFKLDIYEMRIKNLEYQVKFNNVWKTHYRGKPKEWFKDDFNIITDELPTSDNNKYKLEGDKINEK